jgi:hypothetical protein
MRAPTTRCPYLLLLGGPLLAIAACGGQVQGGSGPSEEGGGNSTSAPSASATGTPGRPDPPSPASPPGPPSPTPGSNLPPPAPGECALTGEGFPDGLLRISGSYRELAAYAVVDVKEECSGTGGTHIWLKNLNVELCGGAPIAHLGGHACFPAVKQGDTVIASTYLEKVSEDRPEWCLKSTMPADGRVRAFRVLKPGEDFRKVLREYDCRP